MLLDHLCIACHPSGHCDFFQHYFIGKGPLFGSVCGIWEPFVALCSSQGLRLSHRCCGVSGWAGAGGFATSGDAESTAGWPNTLGACTAAIPGLSGAAAGTPEFDTKLRKLLIHIGLASTLPLQKGQLGVLGRFSDLQSLQHLCLRVVNR